MTDVTSIDSGVFKGDRRLVTIDDWYLHAGPKRTLHWKDGRSAKESANTWLNAAPGIPLEIADLLRRSFNVETLPLWRAEPEALVNFDGYSGPANIDVLLLGEDKSGPMVIAIEAKADETFGGTVKTTLQDARKRKKEITNSNGVARLEQLADRFGFTLHEPEVLELRYQLLTVTAAALSEALQKSAQRAMVIVHEFVTPLTVADKREKNAQDLNHFLHTVFGCTDSLGPGKVVGPFEVECIPKLYFGKAQTRIQNL